MRTIFAIVAVALLTSSTGFGAGPLTEVFDGQLKAVENDVVSLAEAMPADKYDFAPTDGAFKGVRTFGSQVKHIATVIYMVSSSVLGEKPPVDIGTDDNGPAALKTKAELVAYLKGALAFGHKAMAALNEKNQLDQVKSPFGGSMRRVEAASMAAWHSFDHYGQIVVYARMNGIVPPASQPSPPPAANQKK
jgi:uncharacterized damage-inducible protein DinB